MIQIHATAVSINNHAVLIRGESGSGKSDLALRLIDQGAMLVADDRCDLDVSENQIIATAPKALVGMLEVRGLGIIQTPVERFAPVSLIVDLIQTGSIERLPEQAVCNDYGPTVAYITLYAFEASATAKVRLSLAIALENKTGKTRKDFLSP